MYRPTMSDVNVVPVPVTDVPDVVIVPVLYTPTVDSVLSSFRSPHDQSFNIVSCSAWIISNISVEDRATFDPTRFVTLVSIVVNVAILLLFWL